MTQVEPYTNEPESTETVLGPESSGFCDCDFCSSPDTCLATQKKGAQILLLGPCLVCYNFARHASVATFSGLSP